MKNKLKNLFGERATLDHVECMLYSHDVANLPAAVEHIVLRNADAVVQPISTEEVISLVKYAKEMKIPLTPRGAGTSGYGGVIPIKKGIVVAFTRMNRILHIDKEKLTVTVEPGVIWSKLEETLNQQGLSLRLYPSSAPGATVGGWVGEGGSGIGSYEYGFFDDNIIKIKAVTPQGILQSFSGKELDFINRAEGTTGFAVEITLSIREQNEDYKVLTAFSDLSDLINSIKEINEANLPLWHINFTTADFIKNKAEAVEKSAETSLHHTNDNFVGHGIPRDHHLLMIVYPAKRADLIESILKKILVLNNGHILDKEAANHEWSDRFYTMRVKSLGPSLIPSEAILPIDSVVEVIKEADQRLEGISMDLTMVNKDSFTLLAFLTGDERTAAYTAGFAKSLVMMDIAKKHGGREYSVGLYFTDAAEEALGKSRLKKITDFKKATDPDNLFNPGKILKDTGNPFLLRTAMKLGKLVPDAMIESAEKILSNKPKDKKKLADAITRASYTCAQCGYCTDTCTLYMGYQWESASPRGKWYVLRQYLKGNLKLDQKMVDKILMCTTCKRCNPVCQVGLPIMELWDEFRPLLVNEMGFATYNGFEMMGNSVHSDLNIWAGRRSERTDWIPTDVVVEEQAEIAYWAGCTASFVTKNTSQNAVHILKEGGVDFCTLGKDEGCCGTPMLVAGKLDTFEFIFRNNIEGLMKRGVKEIVISCPGCYMAFAHAYPAWAKKLGYPYDFKLKHISEKAEELLNEGKLQFKQPVHKKITWHDSCHIGRHSGIYDAPRNVLKGIPGIEYVEMDHHKENALCCGSVLTRIGEPPVADKLGSMRVQEAKNVEAEALLATCPCCEVQLRASAKNTGINMPILDFTNIVVEALGYEAHDDSEFTLFMWEIFEKALEIMTVDGIVDMMSDMLPEVMEAMPSAMKPMLKGMEALPGAIQDPPLALMEKMIPTLMPMLLPSMMPKLMPKVLELMKQYIPDMPIQMEEKLPAMLPAVMDKIMPAMLPQVAPKLAPRMIEYMRRKKLA